MARAITLAFVATVLLASACGGKSGGPPAVGADITAIPSVAVIPLPMAQTPVPEVAQPEAIATALPETAFSRPSDGVRAVRLLAPVAKVNAPLQTKGWRRGTREMDVPDGKDNVAWYDFTARPGLGSNAVFAGHLDWYTREKGVFWHLRDLKEGDEVQVRLSDGSNLTYRVVWNRVYPANSAPLDEIAEPTAAASVTLITCEGDFNKRTESDTERRVVRAERTH
jgi:LPXTG-site transpeptidase (sortase) family protein